jgi:hypothetical protein
MRLLTLILGGEFEFSGPNPPQRNGKVESKFQTLYERIHAMFNDLGIVNAIQNGLWAECASIASFYETRIMSRRHSNHHYN